MEIKADARKFSEIECDALVVWVYEGERPEVGALAEIDKRSNGLVTSLIETGELTGKAGETAYLHNPGDLKARRLLLVGAGKQADLTNDVCGGWRGRRRACFGQEGHDSFSAAIAAAAQ